VIFSISPYDCLDDFIYSIWLFKLYICPSYYVNSSADCLFWFYKFVKEDYEIVNLSINFCFSLLNFYSFIIIEFDNFCTSYFREWISFSFLVFIDLNKINEQSANFFSKNSNPT